VCVCVQVSAYMYNIIHLGVGEGDSIVLYVAQYFIIVI